MENKNTFYRPVPDLVETGAKIKSLRIKNGYSICKLKEELGFNNPQTIYFWETGKYLPSIDNLLVLSYLFHVTINDIIVTDKTDNKPD